MGPATSRKRSNPGAAQRATGRILIVDDELENIELAGAILKQKGHHVSVARNGRQALSLARKTRPELILLDIVMPEMDGFECGRQLKADPQTADIPIIFLTGNGETGDTVKAFDLGAVDYITKPFNARELLCRLNTHLTLRHTQIRLSELARKTSKYVSPHVCEAIFSGERDAVRGTQEKEMTVCFTDMVGFTQRTESMGDRDLTEWLNHYCNAMAQICSRHGGTLDKFIGDAVMIFFGDPKSEGVQQDAINAVQMAVEMIQVVEEMDLCIRIGLNSGPCYVGNFGSDQQLNYTVIGNTVNYASRLETKSAAGRILISEHTYELVKDHFWCEENAPVRVKGISRELMTYWVIG